MVYQSCRACAPTRYVHLRSTTYVVLEPLEAPHVPSKRTSSLNRERYAMAVWGNGQNFPLRESYPQYSPPPSSSLELPPYWLRRSRTWWWTGHPLSWGVWGGNNRRPPPFTRPADFSEVGSYRDFSTQTPLVVLYVGGGYVSASNNTHEASPFCFD